MRRALTAWSAGPRACSAAAHSSGAPAVPHVGGGARGVSTTSTGGGGPSSSPLPPPLGDVDRMRMVHDLGAIARKQFPAHPSVRRAALLVPFCHVHGRPSVLFVLRGGADGLMPPEVWCVASVIVCITSSTAFPGGRSEQQDAPPVVAAARQAAEELGISHDAITVLGLHHDVPDARTRTVLTPALAYLGELQGVDLNLAQSRAKTGCVGAFTVSLEHLAHPACLSYDVLWAAGGGAGEPGPLGPLPVFRNLPGDRTCSGVYAAVLHAALRVAVGPDPAYREALYGPLMRHAASQRPKNHAS